MPASIGPLIINSPYTEPSRHWTYDRETRSFDLKDGRRPAGYVRASESSKAFDDPGIFVPLELPNAIRPRVKAWREAGYPGVTGITRRLLEHWRDPSQRSYAFFFCQLEAIETLIWLAEAPPADRQGIVVPGGLHEKLRQGRVLVRNWHFLMPSDPDDGPRVVKKGPVHRVVGAKGRAYRYGGEEISELLANYDPVEAFALAERIRTSIAECVRVGDQAVAVSVGLACHPDDVEPAKLTQAADTALYAAKLAGRSQTRRFQADMLIQEGKRPAEASSEGETSVESRVP